MNVDRCIQEYFSMTYASISQVEDVHQTMNTMGLVESKANQSTKEKNVYPLPNFD